MKIQCPYCMEISEWKDGQCPICRKFAKTPGFFNKSSKRTTGRRERDFGIATPWLMGTGGFYNIGIIFKSIPRWVIVFGVIAIIGALWQASTMKPDQSVAIQRTRTNLSTLIVALEAFKKDCGRFPSTDEGLAALVTDPHAEGWKGPYILTLKPDLWKQPYYYKTDGSGVKLFSAGPDRKVGTSDDIFVEKGLEPSEKDFKPEGIGVSIGTPVK